MPPGQEFWNGLPGWFCITVSPKDAVIVLAALTRLTGCSTGGEGSASKIARPQGWKVGVSFWQKGLSSSPHGPFHWAASVLTAGQLTSHKVSDRRETKMGATVTFVMYFSHVSAASCCLHRSALFSAWEDPTRVWTFGWWESLAAILEAGYHHSLIFCP